MNIDEVKDKLNSSNKSLLHFTADWCQPCKRMAPIIDVFTKENKDIEYIKIDIDQNPEIAKEYGISGVPTFIANNDGDVIRKIGAMPISDVRSMFLSKPSNSEFFESARIPEKDAIGREKFWEDMGRP